MFDFVKIASSTKKFCVKISQSMEKKQRNEKTNPITIIIRRDYRQDLKATSEVI